MRIPIDRPSGTCNVNCVTRSAAFSITTVAKRIFANILIRSDSSPRTAKIRPNMVSESSEIMRKPHSSDGKLAIATFVLLYSVSALGQEQDFNFELTPYGAYRVGGEFEEQDTTTSIDIDDSGSYGLIFNVSHSPVTQWEIIYSRQETNADASQLGLSNPAPDLSVEYLQAGGTYLWDGEHVRPYLAATIGGTRIDVDSPGFDDDTFFSFSLGLGLQIKPSNRLGIRLEARGFGTLLDADSDLFCQFGPANNICAVRINGSLMWQTEALAGIVFRF